MLHLPALELHDEHKTVTSDRGFAVPQRPLTDLTVALRRILLAVVEAIVAM